MTDSAPKTALVLSAGGMFGAYQAGACQELEKVFQPDLIVGASIGSLNGWLLAGGVPASDVVDRWLNLHDAASHRFRLPARLSEGILDSVRMERWIREVFESVKPQCAYSLVTTELASMRPRSFHWPNLEWTHLAASCAVPLFLKQQRINGRLHGDGGLVDPLPSWVALEAGATRIVTINLLVTRPMLVRTTARIAALYGRYRVPDMGGVEILRIEPAERLGTVRDSMYWTRGNAEKLIEQGRADAKRALRECSWTAGEIAGKKVSLHRTNI